MLYSHTEDQIVNYYADRMRVPDTGRVRWVVRGNDFTEHYPKKYGRLPAEKLAEKMNRDQFKYWKIFKRVLISNPFSTDNLVYYLWHHKEGLYLLLKEGTTPQTTYAYGYQYEDDALRLFDSSFVVQIKELP